MNRIFVFILIIVILRIVYYYYYENNKIKKESNFWKYQPVTHFEKKYSDFKTHSFKKPDLINIEGYKIITLDNNNDIKIIKEFLDLNYIYGYEYSVNYLKMRLNNNSLCFGLISNNNPNKLLGFISSIPLDVVFYNKIKFKISYVDFLCVDKTIRDNKLATMLISYIVYYSPGLHILYKKDQHSLPIENYNKTRHYSIYVNAIVDKYSNINKYSYYSLPITTKNVEFAFKIYNSYTKTVDHFIKYDIVNFARYFIELKNQNISKIIYDKNKKPIGMFSSYLFNFNTSFQKLKTTELYFFYCIDKTQLESVLVYIFTLFKENNISTIVMLPNKYTNEFIKDNNFIESMELRYYAYNLHVPKLDEFVFCLP